MTKNILILLTASLLFTTKSFSQQVTNQEKEINFEKEIDFIVEELIFMYDTDQALREYTLFRTYNKAVTDSIERLPQEEIRSYMKSKKFKFSKDFRSNMQFKENDSF